MKFHFEVIKMLALFIIFISTLSNHPKGKGHTPEDWSGINAETLKKWKLATTKTSSRIEQVVISTKQE